MTFEPFKAIESSSFFSTRIKISGMENDKGIRCHGAIVSFLLKILGLPTVEVRDVTGNVWNLNRNSLANFISRNSGALIDAQSKANDELKKMLDEVATRKGSKVAVATAMAKNGVNSLSGMLHEVGNSQITQEAVSKVTDLKESIKNLARDAGLIK
jgi:hypothetical protein